MYFVSGGSLNQQAKNIINEIVNELFTKAHLPQVKCLVENLCEISYKNNSNAKDKFCLVQNQSNTITYLAAFLCLYFKMINEESNNQTTANTLNSYFISDETLEYKLSINQFNLNKYELLKLYSVLKIFSKIFGMFN